MGNDLNLRFERTPSSRHMTYLKEQKQRRDADEGIMFAEGECMDNYYATRLSDWMNKKPDTFGQTETICRQEEKMAAEIDRKARAERLKKLFDEENEKRWETTGATGWKIGVRINKRKRRKRGEGEERGENERKSGRK